MNRSQIHRSMIPLMVATLSACLGPSEPTGPGGGGGGGTSGPSSAGDLVITEIMFDPTVVADSDGEWFEIRNATSSSLNLQGLVIRDAGTDSIQVTASLVVAAGSHVVLGRNATLASNGGAPVDFAYAGMSLANTSDEIRLYVGATLIDGVAYGAGYPMVAGRALNLGMGGDHTHNDVPTNWCGASATYGAGDYGTPKAVNPLC